MSMLCHANVNNMPWQPQHKLMLYFTQGFIANIKSNAKRGYVIMGISAIKKLAMSRLKCNLSKAVSLLFLSLITFLCIRVLEQMLLLLFESFKIADIDSSFFTIPLDKQFAQIIAVILSVFIVSPLFLSIKKWYIEMLLVDPPVSAALHAFYCPRAYFSAVWYCFVKNTVSISIFTILLLPVIIAAGIFRSEIREQTSILAILLTVIFVAVIILLLVAAAFAVYFALGFFYADYIFLSDAKSKKNPFKVIAESFRLAKHHRKSIGMLLISMLPLILLCAFIIPALFVIPFVNTTLAFYAQQHIQEAGL